MNESRRGLTVFFLLGSLILALAQPTSPPVQSIMVPPGSALPNWPRIKVFAQEPTQPRLRSKDWEMDFSKQPLQGFVWRVTGHPVGLGLPPSVVGYVANGELKWLDANRLPLKDAQVVFESGAVRSRYEFNDPDGATWHIKQRFWLGHVPNTVEAETQVSVDEPREVAFLPMMLVFPGAGGFETRKGQGLFAGLEYLDNEPSSSEADIIGPASKRQVPDNLKITFPLMAIQGDDRFIALTWQMRPHFSALFDTPDRMFKSGASVMGILFPGSNGKDREEGSVLPRETRRLHANETVSLHATLLAGPGQTVVPAVQNFLALRPLPDIPSTLDLPQYASLAAGGWLDSKIRENTLIRHALAGDAFKPQPAADAALWMQWLAAQGSNSTVSARLLKASSEVLSAVPPEQLNTAGVGHIRYPAESLIFGHVAETAERAEQTGRELLERFDSNGSVRYQARERGPDYAKTHFSDEASGLASRVVLDLLESAAFSGSPELLEKALVHLRDLDRFHNGVPRGAQTWECPLHTPDILASAQMVRAYTLGFELTHDSRFLEEAKYWAWTGVPFVYLVNPTEAPVGLYSTIAVFGATNWRAPVWFGLPVQWCGLVYSDALYRLAPYDPKGPWRRLAEGITASGVQQCWKENTPDLQGLLPDSFALRQQQRNGPAINPATVEACASRYFTSIPVYDFRGFSKAKVFVHAPGDITGAKDSKGRVGFKVRCWTGRPYYVLVNGITETPRLRVNGEAVECLPPRQYLKETGRLILPLEGPASVDIQF